MVLAHKKLHLCIQGVFRKFLKGVYYVCGHLAEQWRCHLNTSNTHESARSEFQHSSQFQLPSNSVSGRQQEVAQLLEVLPAAWEIRVAFLAIAFTLV